MFSFLTLSTCTAAQQFLSSLCLQLKFKFDWSLGSLSALCQWENKVFLSVCFSNGKKEVWLPGRCILPWFFQTVRALCGSHIHPLCSAFFWSCYWNEAAKCTMQQQETVRKRVRKIVAPHSVVFRSFSKKRKTALVVFKVTEDTATSRWGINIWICLQKRRIWRPKCGAFFLCVFAWDSCLRLPPFPVARHEDSRQGETQVQWLPHDSKWDYFGHGRVVLVSMCGGGGTELGNCSISHGTLYSGSETHFSSP